MSYKQPSPGSTIARIRMREKNSLNNVLMRIQMRTGHFFEGPATPGKLDKLFASVATWFSTPPTKKIPH